jgi:hypothetical protein
MKIKGGMVEIVKRWYSDIADLRQRHKLLVVIRDNSGENKSQDIIKSFESAGVKNYFSNPNEQLQIPGRMVSLNRQSTHS